MHPLHQRWRVLLQSTSYFYPPSLLSPRLQTRHLSCHREFIAIVTLKLDYNSNLRDNDPCRTSVAQGNDDWKTTIDWSQYNTQLGAIKYLDHAIPVGAFGHRLPSRLVDVDWPSYQWKGPTMRIDSDVVRFVLESQV